MYKLQIIIGLMPIMIVKMAEYFRQEREDRNLCAVYMKKKK